jgi:pimeloyl-ACP methyl ester carboxylesterase
MDSLGVRNAIVVGFNLGASIALRLAYRHPECVSSVLSIDGGPVDRPTTSGVSVAMRLAPLLRLFGARGMARRRIRSALTEYAADPWWVTDSVVDGYARPLTNDIGASLRVREAANH